MFNFLFIKFKNSKLRFFKDLFCFLEYTDFNDKLKLLKASLFGILSGCFEIASLAVFLPLLQIIINPTESFLPGYLKELFLLFNINGNNVFSLSLLFSFVALSGALIRSYSLYLSGIISAEVGVSITDKAFKSILFKPYKYFITNSTTNLVAAFAIKQGQISVIIQNLLNIVTSTFILISILMTLIIINYSATLITFTTLFISYSILNNLSILRLKNNSAIMAKNHSLSVKSIQKSFDSIRDIILQDSQMIFSNEFKSLNFSVRRKYAENAFFGNFPKLIIEPIALITILSAVLLDSYINNFSVKNVLPEFGSVALGLQKLLPVMQMIYSSFASSVSISQSANDVMQLISKEKSKLNSHLNKIAFSKNFIFKNVSFYYLKDRGFVLKDINLKIDKGEKVGIIGTSGSGKSTLLDLILGLIKPSFGEIKIDGKNIYEYKNLIKAWQKKVAHVPQEVALHDLSVAENIALGIPLHEIDTNLINKCLDLVQLRGFVENLPLGIKSTIGDRGISLSGGQCQRLGIARAIYKQKDVLILDEATSKLDEITEAKILKKLFNDPNLTLISISHKNSILDFCNKVYEINKNKLRVIKNA